MVPGRSFPLAKRFSAEGDQSMKAPQEVWQATSNVGYHQVLVRAHESDGVNEHTKLLRTHRERVEVELPDGGVWTEEVVPTERASGDHDGGAWEDEPRLGHTSVGKHKAHRWCPVLFQCVADAHLANIGEPSGERQRASVNPGRVAVGSPPTRPQAPGAAGLRFGYSKFTLGLSRHTHQGLARTS